MLVAEIGSGFLLGKLFSWVGGVLIGSLAGLIVGFMLGRGVNPLKWVLNAFTKEN